MRHTARILPLLLRLGHAWMREPDLRLGQLITNAMAEGPMALFYIEDEELVKRVEQYIRPGTRMG